MYATVYAIVYATIISCCLYKGNYLELNSNKTPAKALSPPAITICRRVTSQAHLQVFYMGIFSSRLARLVSFKRDFDKRAFPFVDMITPDVLLKTLLQSKIWSRQANQTALPNKKRLIGPKRLF